jgi:hypothetical protein
MVSSKIDTLKLDKNTQIIDVFSRNEEIVNRFSRFKIAVEQLNLNQKKLMVFSSVLTSNSTDSSEKSKNNCRIELVSRILPVITILQVFAYDRKKKKLQNQLKCLTSDYIKNSTDIELVKISKKIWMVANKYGAYSLAFIKKIKSSKNIDKSKAIIKLENGYGLVPEMVKNIEEANIRFIESLLIFRGELKERENILNKIKKNNKQADRLLVNKIDRFMMLVDKENSGFYKEYFQEREKQLLSGLKEKKLKEELVTSKDILGEENKAKKNESDFRKKTSNMKKPAKKAEA